MTPLPVSATTTGSCSLTAAPWSSRTIVSIVLSAGTDALHRHAPRSCAIVQVGRTSDALSHGHRSRMSSAAITVLLYTLLIWHPRMAAFVVQDADPTQLVRRLPRAAAIGPAMRR